MTAPDGHAWQRLGELLVARRTELGHPKRLPFAKHHGLTHDRTLSDLENARRTRLEGFDPATLAQVEQIYQWAPGSIRKVLAGGDPVKLDDDAPPDDIVALLPPGALDGLSDVEREEVLAIGKAAALARAREIKRERDL